MPSGIPNVGAQDPELKNSPVAEEMDEEAEVLRQELPGGPACYFNGTAYQHGALVRSGDVMLRCDRGIWIQAGPGDPENP